MRPDRVVVAAFAVFVVIIGSAPVAIRLGSFELPPLWAAGLRFGIAGIILVGLAVAGRVPFPRGANLVGAVLFGLLLYGVTIPLAYIGLTQAPAAMASISDAFLPLEALLIAAAIGLEQLKLRGLAGALVAVVGVAVIVSNQLSADVPPLAIAALGGSTLATALLLVVLKRIPPGHPTSANAVAMGVGTPILLLLSALAHEPWGLPSRAESWAAFAFLVLGATVVGYQLGLFVVARWTASASSYAFLLAPLVAVVVAAIVLAEPIRAATIVGGALIVGGTWLGAFTGASETAARPAPVGA
jgi:drug/metabolite transporter (DMT)-like permease